MTASQKQLCEKLLHFMQKNNGTTDEDADELNEKFNESDSTIRKHLQLLEDEGYSTIDENTHTLTAKGLAFESFIKEEKKERTKKWAEWPKTYWYYFMPIVFLLGFVFRILIEEPLKSHLKEGLNSKPTEQLVNPCDSLNHPSSNKPKISDSTPKGQ